MDKLYIVRHGYHINSSTQMPIYDEEDGYIFHYYSTNKSETPAFLDHLEEDVLYAMEFSVNRV